MGGIAAIPPRNGEGDRAQHGGGVYATSRETIAIARRERRSGNLPEVVLWRELRARPGGLKFRRQHPISRYVLDFACLNVHLAIEIDGEAHSRGDRPRRDHRRDADLAALGFRILRIAARDVLGELDSTVRAIVDACTNPLHQPTAGPPPRFGEVLEQCP